MQISELYIVANYIIIPKNSNYDSFEKIRFKYLFI